MSFFRSAERPHGRGTEFPAKSERKTAKSETPNPEEIRNFVVHLGRVGGSAGVRPPTGRRCTSRTPPFSYLLLSCWAAACFWAEFNYKKNNKMSNEEKRRIYNAALNQWGLAKQTFMVMEECGELLNVLAKAMRYRATKAEIITELADVAIMVEQMAFFYGEKNFIAEKERKLERLKNRLEIYSED